MVLYWGYDMLDAISLYIILVLAGFVFGSISTYLIMIKFVIKSKINDILISSKDTRMWEAAHYVAVDEKERKKEQKKASKKKREEFTTTDDRRNAVTEKLRS